MKPRSGPVAAIDCGTNSTRLLIANSQGDALVRLMKITRLGQGVDRNGRLHADAVSRTLDVLIEYAELLKRYDVTQCRMVATSAVRDAKNGNDFLRAAATTVGVPAELLSGDEEGRLSYLGAVSDLDPSSGTTLVIDIGGGSTELVLGSAGSVDALSLELGCVRLTERYFAHDPPTREELETAERAVSEELCRAEELMPRLRDASDDGRMIGLAGTVSTLSALNQKLGDYNREQLHHSNLTVATVRKWFGVLCGMPASERASLPGMTSGREDVILGGVIVLREAMERMKFAVCLVSESDILDGMVISQLGENRSGGQ